MTDMENKQVTFTPEEFDDFLDYYSDFVLLWRKYVHNGLVKDDVNFDMVKDDLVSLCYHLDENLKIEGDRSYYHERAEAMFVSYLEINEWLLPKTNPRAIFYEGKWHMADLIDAVESLKKDDLILPETFVDYSELANYVKKSILDDHTDDNEKIRYAIQLRFKQESPDMVGRGETMKKSL